LVWVGFCSRDVPLDASGFDPCCSLSGSCTFHSIPFLPFFHRSMWWKEGRKEKQEGKEGRNEGRADSFPSFFREKRPSSPAPKTEIVFDQRRTLWVLGCRICTSQCKIPSLPRRTNEPKTDLDLFPFLSCSQLRPHLLGRRREPSGTCLVACSRGKGDG